MYPKKLSKILIPTTTIERKNDNSHNSIIHYITGACSIDASQIGLAKQTKKKSIWKKFFILQNFQNP